MHTFRLIRRPAAVLVKHADCAHSCQHQQAQVCTRMLLVLTMHKEGPAGVLSALHLFMTLWNGHRQMRDQQHGRPSSDDRLGVLFP